VEIARLQKVRALLVNDRPKRGRPAKAASVSPVEIASGKKRVLNPEAKERIRQGQLKRWAAAKKATQSKCQKSLA
jgi:phage terminase small subunit